MLTRNKYQEGKWFSILLSSLVITAGVLLLFGSAAFADENEPRYYRIISTVEYNGEVKFRNEADGVVTVQKQILPEEKVQYSLSGPSGQQTFVLDKKTKQMLNSSNNLEFQQKVNNLCVPSLQEITAANIGKTWKQAFGIGALGGSFPEELKFTLTAMELETETLGKMIAVRAMSEPFTSTISSSADGEEKIESVKCRVNSVYLFDSEVDEVYLSSTVFLAEKKIGALKSGNLRYEVATYKVNSAGESSMDLSKLNKKFREFVQKIGLVGKPSVKLKGEDSTAALPVWVKSGILNVAQAGNICSALACEGGVNPVGPIFVASNQMFGMQALNTLGAVGGTSVVSGTLGGGVGIGGAALASPTVLGMSPLAAGAVTAGAVGGGVAAGSGGGGGGGGGTTSP